jgi:hypothetical protein
LWLWTHVRLCGRHRPFRDEFQVHVLDGRTPGLSRRGYDHGRLHISYIDGQRLSKALDWAPPSVSRLHGSEPAIFLLPSSRASLR